MTDRPTKSAAEWRAHWDTRAGVEDPIAAAGYCVAGKRISEAQSESYIQLWLSLLELRSDLSVLEVGFGTALILRRLERICSVAAGIDISPAMVARYSGSAVVRIGEARELPFPVEAFDRVLMASVAHYFPNVGYMETVLAEIARVLRPDGLAVLADVLIEAPASGAPYMWYEREELARAVTRAACTFEIAPNDDRLTGPRTRVDIVMRKPGPREIRFE